MKRAICLHGHYRTFNVTEDYWRELLLNSDVYFHIWDTLDSTSSSHWKGRNTTTQLGNNEIYRLRLYNPKYIKVDKQTWTPEEHALTNPVNMPLKAYIYFWNGIYECLTELKKTGIKYDQIIIGRYDVAINSTLAQHFELKELRIYTSENRGVKYKQYTDSLICFSMSEIDVLLAYCLFVESDDFKQLYINMDVPEQIFNQFLEKNKIERLCGWTYENATIIR